MKCAQVKECSIKIEEPNIISVDFIIFPSAPSPRPFYREKDPMPKIIPPLTPKGWAPNTNAG